MVELPGADRLPLGAVDVDTPTVDGGMADDRTGRYARRLTRLAAVTLAVHAALAAAVYRDAAGRDVSGARWAALVLVGGLPVLPLYLRRR